jgi:hypothetical protein
MRALRKVDFPTLGRPTMATYQTFGIEGVSITKYINYRRLNLLAHLHRIWKFDSLLYDLELFSKLSANLLEILYDICHELLWSRGSCGDPDRVYSLQPYSIYICTRVNEVGSLSERLRDVTKLG